MLSNRNVMIVSALLLAGFMQVLYPIPSPVPTNQLFLMLGALVVLMHVGSDGLNIKYPCALFLAAIIISILGNNIPVFFKPWSRLMQFLFLFIAGSPLLSGEMINRIRRHMTMGVLWACSVISVGSFVAYITGTGQYLSGIIQGYMGITAHPNFLGMFVMIAMVWLMTLLMRSTKTWEYTVWGSCWLMSLIVLLMAASRASLACALFGSAGVLYMRFRKNAGKMFNAVAIVSMLVFFSLPYLLPYMGTLLQKGVSTEEGEADALVAATRGSIWDLRIQELDESPWIGVGAYSCDIHLPNAEVFYSENTGSIELGSSYLGMLSQLGWFGFLAYLAIFIPVYYKAYKVGVNENTPFSQLMVVLLTVIAIHMIVEGYAITGGAVQCVIMWFVIGTADQSDTVADYPVFWEEEDPINPQQYAQWKKEQIDD